MDNQETKEAGKSGPECCSKAKCCGGKALAAALLLAVGGLGGYFCGRGCPVKDTAPSVQTPVR